MTDSPQSIRIPPELDTEVARFVEETGVYTSKSEFVREAVYTHLQELNIDTEIMALSRNDQVEEMDHDEIHATLDAIADEVDPDTVDKAIEEAEKDVAESVFKSEPDTE